VEEQSTTLEYENFYQTTEEPTTVKTQTLTETVSIFPGKITETKIYANAPTKTSVFIQPVEENQLSQGSTLLLFLLAALLFCAFLMASTIAIVSSFQNGRLTGTKLEDHFFV
jgi:hypothetical protein